MPELPIPQHFRYCPKCGADGLSHAEGRSNSVQCSPCGFTLYFNPTCSAAAFIFDATGKLLVVERAKQPSKGKYGVPGGFADAGERFEEAVAREVKEEVGLELASFTFLASFPNEYHYKSVVYPVIDTYFTATVESFDAMAPETSEVARIHFVDPAQVPDEQWAFPSLRLAIRHHLATLP